ncbi:MAG TPA: cyclic lactone autoinducer peptide [Firmicutes bacterium]|nr:cyclic lactone autoinducer peptide [Bacillota bacterium]
MWKSVLLMAVSVLTLLATVTASSACFWNFYQPDVPKALQKW